MQALFLVKKVFKYILLQISNKVGYNFPSISNPTYDVTLQEVTNKNYL